MAVIASNARGNGETIGKLTAYASVSSAGNSKFGCDVCGFDFDRNRISKIAAVSSATQPQASSDESLTRAAYHRQTGQNAMAWNSKGKAGETPALPKIFKRIAK